MPSRSRRISSPNVSVRAAVGGGVLSDQAALGGRFATEAEAPSLAWIMFHVLQGYSRHAGHLDIARELDDGATGE